MVAILADPHGAADTALTGDEPPVGISGWVGRNGARCALHEMGPIPGPPPPWGMEKVCSVRFVHAISTVGMDSPCVDWCD